MGFDGVCEVRVGGVMGVLVERCGRGICKSKKHNHIWGDGSALTVANNFVEEFPWGKGPKYHFLRKKKDFSWGKSAERSFFVEKKRISCGKNSQL